VARPNEPKSVFLDSNVLIDVINGTSPPGAEVLRLAQQGKIELWISALALVEVLGKRRGQPFNQSVEDRVLAALEHPSVFMVECGRATAYTARMMAITYSLKPLDAVQLASAVEAGAEVMMTLDKKDFPIGQLVRRTWVDEPYVPGPVPIPGL